MLESISLEVRFSRDKRRGKAIEFRITLKRIKEIFTKKNSYPEFNAL